MLSLLCSLCCLVCPTLQEVDYEALIVRLRWSDPKDREGAAAKLAAGGEKVQPLLEKATAKTKDGDVLARIEQVRARIRLRLHTPGLDGAFTAPFRKAAPELISRLRNPTPEILLEALEAATGYVAAGDRVLLGVKIQEASRADAILIYRICLAVIPVQVQDASWSPVKRVMGASSHLYKSAALLEDGLVHLEDGDDEFRRVIFGLSESSARMRMIPAYIRLLDTGPADARTHASLKLGALNLVDFVDAVLPKLDGVGSAGKASLLAGLARTGDPRCKPVLIRAIEASDPMTRGAALRGLALLAPGEAAAPVIRFLESSDPQVVQEGIMAAGGLPDPRVVEALGKIVLSSKDVHAIRSALYTLSICRPKNFAELIEKSMDHSSPVVRSGAASNAHAVGGEAIIRKLKSLLEDSESGVRRNAEWALAYLKVAGFEGKAGSNFPLADLKDPSCVQILLDSLEGVNETGAMDGFMRLRMKENYDQVQNLEMDWPQDHHPTVREVIDLASASMKKGGFTLNAKLLPADEKPLVRRNSGKMVVGLIYWLISVSLGQEYGWYSDERSVSLLPIDDARRLWREWAQKQAGRK